VSCSICGGALAPIGSATLLGRHRVAYFRCTACGYTCTEPPYWLDEAYAEAITASDVGLVGRNLRLARVARAVILAFFGPRGPFLDYGAGYGLLVRLLRDKGLDVHWHDPHSANLFAQCAPADLSGATRYRLLTAFELFEHLPDPVAELTQMLRLADSVLFSTTLLPAHMPGPGGWWYYGLEHGQHVSLYTRRSLEALAARFGLNLYSDGRELHLMTPRRLPRGAFALATRPLVALLVDLLVRGRSLVPADYQRVTGRPLG